jgi:hypothetical protein
VNLSPMARMYMGDVEDHANTVVESMEDLIDQSDALVVGGAGWGAGAGVAGDGGWRWTGQSGVLVVGGGCGGGGWVAGRPGVWQACMRAWQHTCGRLGCCARHCPPSRRPPLAPASAEPAVQPDQLHQQPVHGGAERRLHHLPPPGEGPAGSSSTPAPLHAASCPACLLLAACMCVVGVAPGALPSAHTACCTRAVTQTFIAGVYGTNFDNLPGEARRAGAAVCWAALFVGCILLALPAMPPSNDNSGRPRCTLRRAPLGVGIPRLVLRGALRACPPCTPTLLDRCAPGVLPARLAPPPTPLRP